MFELDKEKYRAIMKHIIEEVKINDSFQGYFDVHFDRFVEGITLLNKHIKFGKETRIAELGTHCPFFSLPFVYSFGSSAEVSGIDCKRPGIIFNGIYYRYSNLNYDYFGEELFDLVITTEVFEHIPCNLFDARDRIIRSVKKGGYWFCSFPLKGSNASIENYKKIWNNDFYSPQDHLREFTEDTWKEFVKMDTFQIIEAVDNIHNGYGGTIKHVLLRKNT